MLNRVGFGDRRTRLLEDVATKRGYDRDEYPPALGRGHGMGLTRGPTPAAGAPTSRSSPPTRPLPRVNHGLKLRRFCSGTKFRYVFY